MIETKRHGDAFDYYYSLGNGRSCQAVATKFTVSRTSVHKWKKAFNWPERVIQRDLEINKRTEQKTNTAIVNTKAKYRTDIADRLKETDKLIQRLTTLVAKVSPRIAKGSGQDDGQVDSDKVKELKIDSIKELDEVLQTAVKLEVLRLQLVKQDLALIGEDAGEGNVIINFIGMGDDPFPDPIDDGDV